MFEKFQNKVEKKSEGISLKDKALKVISDTTKIATLISLFSIPLNNEASASSLNEKDPVNLKNKIELAQESIKKINVVLEEKCKGSTHTLGGQEIRSFKLTKGTEVTSANNGDWFILMNKDGSNVFCDYDQDGSVDRFIINNQDEENKKGLIRNAIYAFSSMEDNAQWGQVTSGTPMETDVKISSFDLKNKRIVVVDMKSGKSGIIEGEEAVNLLEKIQIAYTSQLENIVNGVDNNESNSSLSNILDKKQEVPESSKSSPVSNQPEKQQEHTPVIEKSDYHTTFEDFKKAKESEFDAFKKAQEEKFNKFKEGK